MLGEMSKFKGCQLQIVGKCWQSLQQRFGNFRSLILVIRKAYPMTYKTILDTMLSTNEKNPQGEGGVKSPIHFHCVLHAKWKTPNLAKITTAICKKLQSLPT